jgi:hypothetical protein
MSSQSRRLTICEIFFGQEVLVMSGLKSVEVSFVCVETLNILNISPRRPLSEQQFTETVLT